MKQHILEITFAVFILSVPQPVLAGCPHFSPGRKVGTIKSNLIYEASGIAASRMNSGVLWVHNDDNPPYIFAMTAEGRDLGRYLLDGVRNRDWEDIAVGPGPDPNLYAILNITAHEAAAGTYKLVNIPWGFHKRLFRVVVPAGIQEGHKLRLRGLGKQSTAGEQGDLYLKVQIR